MFGASADLGADEVAKAAEAAQGLGSTDSRVRWDACLALAKLGAAAEAHIPALEMLSQPKNEPEGDVRRAAKKAIKEIKTPVQRVVREVKIEEVLPELPPEEAVDDKLTEEEIAWQAQEQARAQREAAEYAEHQRAAAAASARFAAAEEVEEERPVPAHERPDFWKPRDGEADYSTSGSLNSLNLYGDRRSRNAPSWEARIRQQQQAPARPREKVVEVEEDTTTKQRGARDDEEVLNTRAKLSQRQEVAFSTWYAKAAADAEAILGGGEGGTSSGSGAPRAPDAGMSGRRALFRIFKDVLPMRLERESMTVEDVTKIWLEYWGIECANRVKFKVVLDDESKYLRRDEEMPCGPEIVTVEASRGSVLYTLATGLKTYGRMTVEEAVAERERKQEQQVIDELKRAEADAKEQQRYQGFEIRRRYDQRM